MKHFIIFIGMIIFIILIFNPIALIQKTTQNYSVNKILIKYDIYGCGSLVIRIIKGGEYIVNLLKAEYPDIANNEIIFTDDINMPYLGMEFWNEGFTRSYQYIIEGEVIGATKGALKCCAEDENDVAYNDIVPEFRINNWYVIYKPYTDYMLAAVIFICGILFVFIKNN